MKIEYNISRVWLFLEKKKTKQKKNSHFKNEWNFFRFQEFTYYKLKLREQEMCFVS